MVSPRLSRPRCRVGTMGPWVRPTLGCDWGPTPERGFTLTGVLRWQRERAEIEETTGGHRGRFTLVMTCRRISDSVRGPSFLSPLQLPVERLSVGGSLVAPRSADHMTLGDCLLPGPGSEGLKFEDKGTDSSTLGFRLEYRRVDVLGGHRR